MSASKPLRVPHLGPNSGVAVGWGYLQHHRNCSDELSCDVGGGSSEQQACLVPSPLRFILDLDWVLVTVGVLELPDMPHTIESKNSITNKSVAHSSSGREDNCKTSK